MEQRLIQDINIGKNLRRLRQRMNLKQHEVAAQLQIMGLPVSREIYAQIETGRHHIRLSVLLALKGIYEARWEEMLEPAFAEEDGETAGKDPDAEPSD